MTNLPQAPPAPPSAPTLRDYTPARVALATTGISLTTRHALEFALAHAQARDAVYSILDVSALAAALEARALPHLTLHSAASDRATYLHRPDLGRTLSPASSRQLTDQLPQEHSPQPAPETGAPSMQLHRMGGLSSAEANDRTLPHQPQRSTPTTNPDNPLPEPPQPPTLAILLADGLSATATNRHAIPLLDELLSLLRIGQPDPIFRLAPIVIAQQSRVALADPIGLALHAHATLILLGERPGLSSPDSLGAYITWSPRPGRTDAERNCVSNIRQPTPHQDPIPPTTQAGLDYPTAARKIAWYLTEAARLRLTGIALRESVPNLLLHL